MRTNKLKSVVRNIQVLEAIPEAQRTERQSHALARMHYRVGTSDTMRKALGPDLPEWWAQLEPKPFDLQCLIADCVEQPCAETVE